MNVVTRTAAAIDAGGLGDWRGCFDSAAAWMDRLARRPGVSVIVPIYNSADEAARLLGNPHLWSGAAEVLLLDDASTDPRIAALLDAAAQQHANARVLHNRRNLGFVRTVNVGLRAVAQHNDIVALNSDAHPTAGWIDALATSAYAYPDVATVCPLSNAAGFFSVPRHNQSNALPDGRDAQHCADTLLLAAPQLHEIALTTSGFCWYVTRQALAQVGYLDEMMFHRGYAEETDFCLRALDAGFRNVAVLSCFVEHVGGQSFSCEKGELKSRNASILRSMQPDFIARLRAYEASSLIPATGAAFEALLGAEDGLPSVSGGRLQRLQGSLANTDASALVIDLRAAADAQEAEALAVYVLLRYRPRSAAFAAILAQSPVVMRAAAFCGTQLEVS